MALTGMLDRLLVVLGAGLLATTVAVLLFASDKASTSSGADQKAIATDRVVISDFKFMPQTVAVTAGAKVTFVNEDSAAHTATGDATEFDTGVLAKGESKAVTLTKAGDIAYICELHPFMKAMVKVAG